MAKAGPDTQAAETPPGGEEAMGKQELKKLLLRAAREPVNCALALSDTQSGGRGLVLLDKVKPSKALLADLKKQFPTARNPSFGTVSVDAKAEPKMVTFHLNKEFSGTQRKVVKTLRGTGFRKVTIERSSASQDDDAT